MGDTSEPQGQAIEEPAQTAPKPQAKPQ
jgi:hypothetical protein